MIIYYSIKLLQYMLSNVAHHSIILAVCYAYTIHLTHIVCKVRDPGTDINVGKSTTGQVGQVGTHPGGVRSTPLPM